MFTWGGGLVVVCAWSWGVGGAGCQLSAMRQEDKANKTTPFGRPHAIFGWCGRAESCAAIVLCVEFCTGAECGHTVAQAQWVLPFFLRLDVAK